MEETTVVVGRFLKAYNTCAYILSWVKWVLVSTFYCMVSLSVAWTFYSAKVKIYAAIDWFYVWIGWTVIPEPPRELRFFEKHRLWRIQAAYDWIESQMDFELSLFLGFVVGLVVIFLLWVTYRIFVGFFRNSMARMIMRSRGVIIGEAMMAGSSFSSTDPPKSQVRFLIPGLLVDTHQGFGVRTQAGVVTAKHVLAPFVGQSVIVANHNLSKKFLWDVNFTSSSLFADVCYCNISHDILSQLGTPSCTMYSAGLTRAIDATAYGLKGKSSGTLRKNNSVRGGLIYSGSTEAGMSGGGIWSDSALVGIHQGAMEGFNVSVFAPWLLKEAQTLGLMEATHGMSKDDANMMAKLKVQGNKGWDAFDVPEIQAPSGWANVGGQTWADMMDEEARVELKDVKGNVKATYKKVVQQSADGLEVETEVSPGIVQEEGAVGFQQESVVPHVERLKCPQYDRDDSLDEIESALANRQKFIAEAVQIQHEANLKIAKKQHEMNLEAAVLAVRRRNDEEIVPVKEVFVCDICQKVFKLAQGLKDHRASHYYKPQSAAAPVYDDTGLDVPAPFLGQQNPCPKRKSRSSKNTSKSEKGNSQSTLDRQDPKNSSTSESTGSL